MTSSQPKLLDMSICEARSNKQNLSPQTNAPAKIAPAERQASIGGQGDHWEVGILLDLMRDRCLPMPVGKSKQIAHHDAAVPHLPGALPAQLDAVGVLAICAVCALRMQCLCVLVSGSTSHSLGYLQVRKLHEAASHRHSYCGE